jgi:predicted transposase/invertase (TIGR01784 family)
MALRERYINPYTDFGFKKLFGTEINKDLLMSFLNSFLDTKEAITSVKYLNSERLGDGVGDRRSVFDVYCETEKGEKFIVEMQKAGQRYFKDRSVYYSTTPIREQAQQGEWNFRLENVYTVGVLDFVFPNNEYPADEYYHVVKLMDVADKHVFYDKLTFVYLEMPKFNKTEDELETMFDKWMYALRNLSRLLDRPKALQDRIFEKFFNQAEIAQYNEEERREYETSVKNYRDYINTMDYAHDNGWKEANVENARKMKADGMPTELIAKYTSLSIDEIATL